MRKCDTHCSIQLVYVRFIYVGFLPKICNVCIIIKETSDKQIQGQARKYHSIAPQNNYGNKKQGKSEKQLEPRGV